MATSIEYIKELKEYLLKKFAGQKAAITTSRELRNLKHVIRVPDEFRTTAKVYRTPIINDITQRVTSQLSVNLPTYHRAPVGESEGAKQLSGVTEHWLTAADERMEAEANRRIFRMGMSAAIKDGMGVWELTYRPDAWPAVPRRRKGEQDEPTDEDARGYVKRVDEFYQRQPFLFSWRDVDPLTYYFHDGPRGINEVIVVEQVPLAPTARALGVYRGAGDRIWQHGGIDKHVSEGSMLDTRELIRYCGPDEYVYILDDNEADRISHKWGRPPYVHFGALSSHEHDAQAEFQNVVFTFEHLVPLLDALITMKMNWAYFGAFPRTVIKLTQTRLQQMVAALPSDKQAEAAANVASMMSQLGNVITLYEGESAEFMDVPNVGADLNQMIQLTMQLIDAAGISNVLRGQSPGGDPNGYLYNQMTTMAHMVYDPVTDNARFAVKQKAALLLEGVETMARRPVPVWGTMTNSGKSTSAWLKLGPKDLDGYYNVDVHLEPLLPSNYIMEGRFWLEQWKAGAVSWRMYVEKGLHESDPDSLEKQMQIERFKASPVVQGYLLDLAAERTGIKAAALERQAAAMAAAQPPMGGPGGAGLGNLGMPTMPGQGMPVDPTQVQRSSVPMMPGNVLPGAGPPQNPGGNFGVQGP